MVKENNDLALQEKVFLYDEMFLNKNIVSKAKLELEGMFKESAEILNAKDSRENKHKSIVNYIFKTKGFISLTGNNDVIKNSNCRFLTNTILGKKGYCVELSLLFLIIARKLNISLYAVSFPMKHMLVGYDTEGRSYNIELTKEGKIQGEDYLERISRAYSQLNKHKAIRCKTDFEILGIYLNLIGHVFFMNGDLEKAKYFFEKEVALTPNFHRAHFSLGYVLYKLGHKKRAIEELEKEIEIDPNFIHAHLWLTYYYLDYSNQHDKALVSLRTILNKIPNT